MAEINGAPHPPLFENYLLLRESLPYVRLSTLPTPIERLETLEQVLTAKCALYVKRDDISGELYGGNKVRKLEFLLGQARAENKRRVLTYGAAGSNHATATALYANHLGMTSINMLMPQPNSHAVRRNLLLSLASNAEIHYITRQSSTMLSLAARIQKFRRLMTDGSAPLEIPYGGSAPLGVAGFVNAAFELKRQVQERLMPAPDVIYVAAGSMGSAVGLALGLKAAGMRCRVEAVRVITDELVNPEAFRALYTETNRYLHSVDPAFSIYRLEDRDFTIRGEFYGSLYGMITADGAKAAELASQHAGLTLDGTYTAKAFAAILADCESGALEGKTALFWHTYNSRDVSGRIEGVEYHRLPKAMHRYFEEDVQPLDR